MILAMHLFHELKSSKGDLSGYPFIKRRRLVGFSSWSAYCTAGIPMRDWGSPLYASPGSMQQSHVSRTRCASYIVLSANDIVQFLGVHISPRIVHMVQLGTSSDLRKLVSDRLENGSSFTILCIRIDLTIWAVYSSLLMDIAHGLGI